MTDYTKQDRATAEYLMMASQETIAAAYAAGASAERERCAKVCEDKMKRYAAAKSDIGISSSWTGEAACEACAAAIRAGAGE